MSLSDNFLAAQNLVAEGKLIMMQMTIADRRLSKISSELAEMGLSLKGEPLQATQFLPPKTPVVVPVESQAELRKTATPSAAQTAPEGVQNAVLNNLGGQAT